jgi:hypothetical protein
MILAERMMADTPLPPSHVPPGIPVPRAPWNWAPT